MSTSPLGRGSEEVNGCKSCCAAWPLFQKAERVLYYLASVDTASVTWM